MIGFVLMIIIAASTPLGLVTPAFFLTLFMILNKTLTIEEAKASIKRKSKFIFYYSNSACDFNNSSINWSCTRFTKRRSC